MELISIFKHALMISFFVFVMMLFVDFIDMVSNGRMSGIIKGGPWWQYPCLIFFLVFLSAFLTTGIRRCIFRIKINFSTQKLDKLAFCMRLSTFPN